MGKVVLFGRFSSYYLTYMISEEGELLEDRSGDSMTPQFSSVEAFAGFNGKIYAVDRVFVHIESKKVLKVFDGKKWAIL